MKPAARIAAAIDVLDVIDAGTPAEQALTRWGRQNRYAGSKDRAAVRDHVFDALRVRRTAQALGQGTSGRALMIGTLRHQEYDLDQVFTGEGHAPEPLTETELARPTEPVDDIWNLPNWVLPEFQRSLSDRAPATAKALEERAPITIRVNKARGSVEAALSALISDGVVAQVNTLSDTALTVSEGARRVRNSAPYIEGLVELQDASSQAVVDILPEGLRCLDFCAGGGGKALALAAQPQREVFAHDAAPHRMKDLPARAERAQLSVEILTSEEVAENSPFDIVLCDAPCSGSGAWRRSPEGKWSLSQARLDELREIQLEILNNAAPLVAKGGALVYATCSVFACENEDIVQAFLDGNSDWVCSFSRRIDVSPEGDGFFTAHLTQVDK